MWTARFAKAALVAASVMHPTGAVEMLTEDALGSCLVHLESLTPAARYNALGHAWNSLEQHERQGVVKDLALIEKGELRFGVHAWEVILGNIVKPGSCHFD